MYLVDFYTIPQSILLKGKNQKKKLPISGEGGCMKETRYELGKGVWCRTGVI